MRLHTCIAFTLSLASCSVWQQSASSRHSTRVADLILALPAHRFEAPAYQKRVLSDGTPQPAEQQDRYLKMPEYALDPPRHFLLLDDHHLLIHSEVLPVGDGIPAQLEILRKNPDSSWTDITPDAVPAWARHPDKVTYSANFTHITITRGSGTPQTFAWNFTRLAPSP